MGDPLSVAASVVGLVSLGIEVSQTLVKYYITYRSQGVDIERTTRKLESLLTVFQSLDKALKQRAFPEDEKAQIETIEESIESCRERIRELQEVLQGLDGSSAKGIKESIKISGRRITYPFRTSTLAKLDENVSTIRHNLSLALQVLQLSDAGQTRNDVEDIKSLLALVWTSQISSAISNWLKAPDSTINHNDACNKRHPATGLWLVKGPKFIDWLEQDASFLWINGFAGCGKSVLCSTAIQYTFRHRRSNSRVGLGFFYFSFNDLSKQDVSGMLRALLLQLSGQLGDQHAVLNRLYQTNKQGTPPVPALMIALQEMVQKFQDVYLVLDALDESPQFKAREDVLKALKTIREWSIAGLHILATSRDLPDIRESIQEYGENISMKNTEVDEDIANFISAHLQESPALQKWSAHHDRIRSALTTRAEGVFRWVECQFQSLATCPRSEAALKRRLDSLPRSLDETYERMLQNIDPDSVPEAQRILTLLCFAERPMSVNEIIDGNSVELGNDPKFSIEHRLMDENDILQICPGLLEISFRSGTSLSSDVRPIVESTASSVKQTEMGPWLSIAHFSVQEYLESDRIRQQKVAIFGMDRVAAHTEIAQICLIYLLDTIKLLDISVEAVLKERPLARYAAEHWYVHYQSSEINVSRIQELVFQLFESEQKIFRNWIRIYDPDYDEYNSHQHDSDQIATAVYYASFLGLQTVLAHLLKTGDSDVNAKGGRYGTALQAASFTRYKDIIQLLLESGADINVEESNFYGTALQMASLRGYRDIVQLLLDNGARINAKGGYYGTALQAASFSGHKDTIQLLIDSGADVNADKRGHFGNPLQVASFFGYKDIIQLLIDSGADVNADKGGQFGNPLQTASFFGYKDITQLLIDSGADVNAEEDTIAPQTAAFRGNDKIKQLLLRNGTDINASSKYGTALHEAAREGNNDTISLLLNNGADINASSKHGTALHVACEEGDNDTILLLLNYGADINVKGRNSETALQKASRMGYDEIVQLLLDWGANAKDLQEQHRRRATSPGQSLSADTSSRTPEEQADQR